MAVDGESLKLQYFSPNERPKLALPYPEEVFLYSRKILKYRME